MEADNPALPDVDIGTSSDAVYTATRFQPIDCEVGETTIRDNGDPWCVGGIDTDIGGYTFGDFGLVNGAPEVHSDGEIWMETLWDLRRALIAGERRARRLEHSGGDRHRGDAPVAPGALVPRHAQRDPGG